MKDTEDELNEKIKFLSEFVTAFKDQIHTDLLLKPGNNGPPVPTHKALMVTTLKLRTGYINMLLILALMLV